MGPRLSALLALGTVALAAAGPAAAEEPVPPRAPLLEDLLEHPFVERNGEKLMEVRGSLDVGYRGVSGQEGRYDQDVNLDPGVVLREARVRGDGLVDGLIVQTFSMDLVGVGDPYTAFDMRARLPEVYDFRIHFDRDESVFLGAYDPHPLDAVRGRFGGSLDFRPGRDLEIHLSTERKTREGDGTLDHLYRQERTLPVATTSRYDGRFHSIGFDATPGIFRFGATGVFGSAADDSVRTLDRPDTPIPDRGNYAIRADFESVDVTGRAGVRLFGGKLDIGVLGGWGSASTDAEVTERAQVVLDGLDDTQGTPDDEPVSTETQARTEADTRHHWIRGEALWLPAERLEILARWEARNSGTNGSADVGIRDQAPPFNDPTVPFFVIPIDSELDSRQERASLEARWRASKQWRFRAGGEKIEERVTSRDNTPDFDFWDPETRAALAGVDWEPNDRVELSVLGRAARTKRPAEELSAEDADSLTARLRLRRPDGFRLTATTRLRQRENGEADSVASVDATALAFGHEAPEGWFEATISREQFQLESDTRFVVDLANGPNKIDARVGYEETVVAANLDFSYQVKGPLRTYGTGRAARGRGDLPYTQSDATLGLGWRLSPSMEVRGEARRAAFHDDLREQDDYAAEIWTLSIFWEF